MEIAAPIYRGFAKIYTKIFYTASEKQLCSLQRLEIFRINQLRWPQRLKKVFRKCVSTETGTRNLLLLSRIETCYVILKAKNATERSESES